MVIASHIIFTCYGFWLPNDPRGSWSDYVRSWELYWYGDATKTDERGSVAHRSHDRDLRRAQKSALQLDPVELTGLQAWHIAKGFAKAVAESKYLVYACSIMPAHVHMVVARHTSLAEQIAGHFKRRGTWELTAAGLHPFAHLREADGRYPSLWARKAWKVFLNDSAGIARAIDYVEKNPLKEGKPRQRWSFVTKFR
jgi:REP element-mobilizing transposase RayT